ncbi:MAG TPA: PPC domain-containing protein [Verrucomicrobiae bacterium]
MMFPRAFLLLASTALFAQAQLRLHTVSPAGGKIGSSVNVTLSGEKFDDLSGIQFSHRGIAGEKTGSNTFKITIEKDVPPGTYDVRVLGKSGASNPRAFAAGVLDEVAKVKNSSATPQVIALETTINGRTDTNAVDYFRFEAKQGQRVLMRCDARKLDSKLEPVLTLTDSAGREVAHSRTGGLLDYSPTSDGEFVLRLHDVTYRGSAEFFYRLSVGTFPHIDYALPLADGTKTKFALFGRNLPGGKIVDAKAKPALERLEVELAATDPGLRQLLASMPAQTALDLFEYRIGASEPVLIRFPTAPILGEQEPNNTLAGARKITVPCEIAGQLFPNGDRDWFSFEAKKGDVFWIEVVSHRLGLPTDPFVLLQRATTNGTTDVLELNDSEANIGGAEFNTTHRDPSGKFEVKEDGTYLLQVRDLFTQSQRNPSLVYQLAIRKPSPDFRLAAVPVAAVPAKKDAKDIGVSTTSLRRGETLPMKMVAFRRDGFDGEISVAADLPDGVATASCVIEKGKTLALLFLTAAADSSALNGLVAVRGKSMVGPESVIRTAAPIAVVWGTADPAVEAPVSRAAASGTLSLTEATVPVRVHAVSNVIETTTNRAVKINFLIERSESFSGGALKLKPFGFAALDSVPELDVDAKATNLVLQIDLREKKVPVGTHSFALQVSPQPAPASDKSKKAKELPPAFYSEPVVLHVKPAPPSPTNSPAK